MNHIVEIIEQLLTGIGIGAGSLTATTTVTLVVLDLALMSLSYYVLSRFIEPLLIKITSKTSTKWDDILLRQKAIKWVWFLLPMVIGRMTIPASLIAYTSARSAAILLINLGLVLNMMMVVIETIKSVFLLIADHDNIDTIVEQMNQAREYGEEFVYRPSHSLKGLQQMLVLIVIAFSIILCISLIFGKNPLIVLSGLGAAAAVLMLVFQDSILGVVAGVQLTANDMLQPGDWIKSPKYEANGIVQEVTLAAVKVKNWDQTIVTIPPYKLLTDGFQNWRGMQLAKGRRITRNLNIDLTTIRLATEDEVTRWSKEKWWRKNAVKEDGTIVNLTAFRMFLEYYITKLPTTKHSLLYMIRELEPTTEGLPLQIYFFTTRTEWKSYEGVQADMYDRVVAMVPEFGLKLYQRPSGSDIRLLADALVLCGKTADKADLPTSKKGKSL